ncbi:arginine N-succinyltransferase [Litorimonas sp. RW-G-Af-16]|uniref:arginine N-succinyltransferase n=1 Tax=Litorimonas sp. RW-G-Af-16 TaxID=3241168 RepID=UPI003AAB3A2B
MTLDTPLNIFRLATVDDIAAITAITSAADSGLTTVPRMEARVADYIDQSHRFLAGDPMANRVLFVVERDSEIMGISGIIPKLGLERPFYSFKRSRHARRSMKPNLSVRYDTLQLTNDFDDFTELASIYLAPKARGKGVARLMSLGRLGFIERHRAMFAAQLMADIRGWVDADGTSPFWEHLASKFIQTDFDAADRLSATDGNFIMELLPNLPIMLNLLPKAVDECAGKPHDISAGAMGLLMSAGFDTTDLCDIFDGGPAIICKAERTLIARTRFEPIAFDCQKSDLKFIHYGGDRLAFRAAMDPANPLTKNGSRDIATALGEGLSVSLAVESRE